MKEGYLKPYEDRAAIEDGKLPETTRKILFWASDPVDVFFTDSRFGCRDVAFGKDTTHRL